MVNIGELKTRIEIGVIDDFINDVGMQNREFSTKYSVRAKHKEMSAKDFYKAFGENSQKLTTFLIRKIPINEEFFVKFEGEIYNIEWVQPIEQKFLKLHCSWSKN